MDFTQKEVARIFDNVVSNLTLSTRLEIKNDLDIIADYLGATADYYTDRRVKSEPKGRGPGALGSKVYTRKTHFVATTCGISEYMSLQKAAMLFKIPKQKLSNGILHSEKGTYFLEIQFNRLDENNPTGFSVRRIDDVDDQLGVQNQTHLERQPGYKAPLTSHLSPPRGDAADQSVGSRLHPSKRL